MASSKQVPVALKPAKSVPAQVRLPAVQRREQLIQVAIDLFSEKGFSGTTTKEIAAAAGVTEAIIFRHFETKEHLYTAIIDQKVNSADAAQWIADLQVAMDQDDDELVIRRLIYAIIATHKTDPKFERLMLYAALEKNEIALIYMRQMTACIVDNFIAYVSRRQEQGKFRRINPIAALMAIAGMADHYAMSTYVHGIKEKCLTDDEAIESFTQIAMMGIFTPSHPSSPTASSKRKK